MENTVSKKLIYVNECLSKRVHELVMTSGSCTFSLQKQVKVVINPRMLLKKKSVPICRNSVNKNHSRAIALLQTTYVQICLRQKLYCSLIA